MKLTRTTKPSRHLLGTSALVIASLLLAAPVVHAVVQHGTSGDDGLYGTAGSDKLYGGGGKDLIKGYGGDDYLYGGPGGRDSIQGGSGNDHLWDGPGYSDFVYGGPGNDVITLSGDGVKDFVMCDGGTDTVRYRDVRNGKPLDEFNNCERIIKIS